MTQNKTKVYQLAVGTLALALTACGGGGGGNGSPQSTTLSGQVLDGAVVNARVCLDINQDLQCTAADNFVETGSDGQYTLAVSDASLLNRYPIIADVRQSEVSDSDYENGIIDKDYVLVAFDTSATEVNISPVSTLLAYQSATTGKSVSVLLDELSGLLSQAEQFEYADAGDNTYDYTQYLLGNFLEQVDDQHINDFNTRLHNLNEVLARKLQESLALWEDRYWGNDVTLSDTSWSKHSADLVFNTFATTFEGFDTILQEVMNHDFANFNANAVADQLWVDVSPTDLLADFIEYNRIQSEIDVEFEGEPLRFTITSQGLSITTYIVFSPGNIRVYGADETQCTFVDSPFPTENVPSSDALIDSYNEFVSTNNIPDVTYGPMERISQVPADCSSLYDQLASFNFADSYELALGSYKRVDLCKTGMDCENGSASLSTHPMYTSANPILVGNTEPESIGGACSYDGRPDLTDACSSAPSKD